MPPGQDAVSHARAVSIRPDSADIPSSRYDCVVRFVVPTEAVMLGRFLQRPLAPPTADAPRRVPYWGNPELESVGRKALRGDWLSVESVLRGIPVFEVRDATLLAIVHNMSGRPKWLDQWVEARPGDHLAPMFRGAHSLHWAW